MLKKLFNREETNIDAEDVVPEIEDDQTRHHFDEIQILSGHSDIVDDVIKIDNTRILTTGQDKKCIAWDCKTGEIICELVGHKRAIGAAIVIQNYLDNENNFCDVVVTASSDETIKIWDIATGQCKRTVTEHQSAVKCFIMTSSETEAKYVLTAGEDICLWNYSFELLSQFTRNSLDYINTVINVKQKRIVVATDQPHLVVYELKNVEMSEENKVLIKEYKKLSPHRQSITSLVLVSDAMFASASMDGSIIIWTSHRLVAARKYNQFEMFVNIKDHTYPFHVHHLMVVEKRYIFAAIGSGFAIFDSMLEKSIVRINSAHHSQITSLLLLQNGKYLASSSLDGTVRLWGAPLANGGTSNANLGPVSRLFGKNVKDCKRFPLRLDLIGECCGHANSVKSIADCGDEGFVSYDSDGLVILWKDSEKLRIQEDQAIRIVLDKMGWMNTNA